MAESLLRGIQVVWQYSLLLSVISIFWVAGSGLAMGIWWIAYQDDAKGNDSQTSQLAFSLAASPLVGVLLGFVWLVTVRVTSQGVNFWAWFYLGLMLSAGIVLWRWFFQRTGLTRASIVLVGISAFLLVLYLAFISDLFVPLYFDSLEHVQIANDFLHPEASPTAFHSLEKLGKRYYHFGFHTLTSWLSAISGAEVRQVILILGQLLLAGMPLAIFFFSHTLTDQNWHGIWAALLAGVGWAMPAFAVNWGKYPALAALATLPLSLGALEMLCTSREGRRHRAWWLALMLTLTGCTLFHTRALVAFVLYLASKVLVQVWQCLTHPWRLIGGLVLVAGLITLLIRALPVLGPYASPATILLLILLPLSLRVSPVRSLTLLCFIALLLLSLWIPVPFLRHGRVELLDRQFVQMAICIPLSVLAGLGLASLAQQLRWRWSRLAWDWIQAAAWLAFGLALVVGFVNNGLTHPDACCSFVHQSELYAIAWIATEIPVEAKIVIAGFAPPNKNIGNDGGIWINTLTGRSTYTLRYDTNWASAKIHNRICNSGATYVYAGSMSYSFRQDLLEATAWYRPVLVLPPARVYAILDCPE